ncbi:hypothetical protein HDV00_000361, partial [Rhizophlyctis rosea]
MDPDGYSKWSSLASTEQHPPAVTHKRPSTSTAGNSQKRPRAAGSHNGSGRSGSTQDKKDWMALKYGDTQTDEIKLVSTPTLDNYMQAQTEKQSR